MVISGRHILFACQRRQSVSSHLLNLYRTSVTVRWPIIRGHDLTKWEEYGTTQLLEIKEHLKYYEDSNAYTCTRNFEREFTKKNIALLMGVDPEKFTDSEFKLSLKYLFPSDIQKQEYKPKLRNKLPQKSILEMLSEINSLGTGDIASVDYTLKLLQKQDQVSLITKVQNIIIDAEKRSEESPGLDIYLDPEEIITLADIENIPDDEGKGSESLETETTLLSDRLQGLEMEDRSTVEVDSEDLAESEIAVDIVDPLTDPEIYRLFPFRPVSHPNKTISNLLAIQFHKLNNIIEDRPDLIKLYFPYLYHVIDFSADDDVTSGTSSSDSKPTSQAVFRAKTMRYFTTNSVVTTMIPGSGQITINGISYLDFFPHIVPRMIVISPLRIADSLGIFDVQVEVLEEDVEITNSLAHCIAMSVADALKIYCPDLAPALVPCYRRQVRSEYKKAGKKNSRSRYAWRKR